MRDFNYVDDVVNALLLAGCQDDANGKIFNLGGRRSIRLIDFAELLIEINGGGSYELVPFPEDRKRIDIGDYHGDYHRIKHELGWEPKINLREGLTRTLAYYRQHLQHYV
jgi:nucleoside-diphosphate-sugar epimerase